MTSHLDTFNCGYDFILKETSDHSGFMLRRPTLFLISLKLNLKKHSREGMAVAVRCTLAAVFHFAVLYQNKS